MGLYPVHPEYQEKHVKRRQVKRDTEARNIGYPTHTALRSSVFVTPWARELQLKIYILPCWSLMGIEYGTSSCSVHSTNHWGTDVRWIVCQTKVTCFGTFQNAKRRTPLNNTQNKCNKITFYSQNTSYPLLKTPYIKLQKSEWFQIIVMWPHVYRKDNRKWNRKRMWYWSRNFTFLVLSRPILY